MARAVGNPPQSTTHAGALALLAAAFLLAGCQLGGTGPDGTPALRSAETTQMAERDVETPEVFEMTEPGLWDGRPSLGGVWVAHPDATDPERVIIRHAETGASVTGALFRREREHPGPRFQISSEAAAALGILAGAPTPIRVTAVRLQQVEVAPPPPAETEPAADETAAEAAEAEAPRGLRALFQRRRASAVATEPDPETVPDTGTGAEVEPASRAAAPAGVIRR